MVTGDEVAHGKPHPEPYRAAARALGVELQRLRGDRGLAAGVASAVAAGVPTIAVPHAVPVPHTEGAVQIDGLAGVKPADLLRLLR